MKKLKNGFKTFKDGTRRFISLECNEEDINFVPNYFSWKNMSEQKKICDRLANITKRKEE